MNIWQQARALRAKKRRELEARHPTLQARPGAATALSAAPLSPAARENRIVFGRDESGLPFAIPERDRGHWHLLGVPGSGKSNFILHALKQDCLNGDSLILIDAHGGHPTSVFQQFIRWLARSGIASQRTVHIIDPSAPQSCGYNPLYCPPGADPSVVAANALVAIERAWGDQDTRENPSMRRGLRALLTGCSELGLSFVEGPMFLHIDLWNLREWAIATLQNETAKRYLERLSLLAADPRLRQTFEIDSIGPANRLEEFVSSAGIRRVLGHPRGIDLAAVMDRGDIVLVNIGGGPHLFETEGELLGRVLLRGVVFAGPRRTNRRPCRFWADEGQKVLSGDLPSLLEESRKFGISLAIAHQDIGQLGPPGDRIREAMLSVPAHRILFRLNSMAEATLMAPEVFKLNLENPIRTLTHPTVIGHEVHRLRTDSTGGAASVTDNRSHTTTRTDSRSGGSSSGGSRETSTNSSRTDTTTNSQARARGTSDTVSQSTTRSRSTTEAQSESETVTTGTSQTIGESGSQTSSRGGSASTSDSIATGTTDSYGYEQPPMMGPIGWPDSYTASATTTRTASSGTAASCAQASETGRSTAFTVSESTSQSRGRSRAETRGEAQTQSTAHTESESTTEGVAHSTGQTIGTAESVGHTWASTQEHGHSIGTGITSGSSTARSDTWSAGYTEGLLPIMEDRPGAVHSLQNVTHQAAELLCSLPTGTAVVRVVIGGSIQHALVQVPPIDDPAEAVEGVAQAQLLARAPNALPRMEVDRIISERREWLRAQGARVVVPAREPRTFRQPLKNKTSTKPLKPEAQTTKPKAPRSKP
jgi:hypothetical protein